MTPKLGTIYTHFLKKTTNEKENQKGKTETTKKKGKTKR